MHYHCEILCLCDRETPTCLPQSGLILFKQLLGLRDAERNNMQRNTLQQDKDNRTKILAAVNGVKRHWFMEDWGLKYIELQSLRISAVQVYMLKRHLIKGMVQRFQPNLYSYFITMNRNDASLFCGKRWT